MKSLIDTWWNRSDVRIYFSAGVLNMTLGSFESSKISADSIVYANFNNATWSSRVWERQNELRNIVKKGVADTVFKR